MRIALLIENKDWIIKELLIEHLYSIDDIFWVDGKQRSGPPRRIF